MRLETRVDLDDRMIGIFSIFRSVDRSYESKEDELEGEWYTSFQNSVFQFSLTYRVFFFFSNVRAPLHETAVFTAQIHVGRRKHSAKH